MPLAEAVEQARQRLAVALWVTWIVADAAPPGEAGDEDWGRSEHATRAMLALCRKLHNEPSLPEQFSFSSSPVHVAFERKALWRFLRREPEIDEKRVKEDYVGKLLYETGIVGKKLLTFT